MITLRKLSLLSMPTVAFALMACLGTGCAEPDAGLDDTSEEPATFAAQVSRATAGLKLLRTEGTGCRPESVTSFYDPETKTVVVQFSEYGVDLRDNQRTASADCTITLEASHPQGLGRASVRVQFRGYAILPAGTSAALKTSYAFAGATTTPRPQSFAVPKVQGEPWVFVQEVKTTTSDRAVKRNLVINTSLVVNASRAGLSGHVDMESVESSLLPR